MAKVYNCLSKDPVHFDDIIAATGLSQTQIVMAIMQLEMAELVIETESKKYILK